MASPSEDWISLARVVKTQGHRGEVAAELLTDIPGRFESLQQISLLAPSGERRSFQMTSHWFHQGRVVLALAGITDPDAARAWIGAELQVPRSERASAPPGSYFQADLVGCQLWDGDHAVGAVTRVADIPGAAPMLHVETAAGNEVLIPFVEAFLRGVELTEKRINMRLPEGLIEANTPAERHRG